MGATPQVFEQHSNKFTEIPKTTFCRFGSSPFPSSKSVRANGTEYLAHTYSQRDGLSSFQFSPAERAQFCSQKYSVVLAGSGTTLSMHYQNQIFSEGKFLVMFLYMYNHVPLFRDAQRFQLSSYRNFDISSKRVGPMKMHRFWGPNTLLL